MIRSMTGFVTKKVFFPGRGEVVINIRSLNFKYLDIHISRIPQGLEGLEKFMYQEAVKRFRRGRLEIFIGFNSEGIVRLPQQKILAIKQAYRAALRGLIEFKKIQGMAAKKDLRTITKRLTRRSHFFKKYLKKEVAVNSESAKDIFEEVSLIAFYLKHVSKILEQEKRELGKILDFLSQELLRETNTILAKIKDRRFSLEAVYFKEEIDRLRELAQNIE